MRLEPLISHTGILINNSRFAEFLPLIYPPELEVKETTDRASSASFLDLYLEFDDSGQLSTKNYEKNIITLICRYSFGHYLYSSFIPYQSLSQPQGAQSIQDNKVSKTPHFIYIFNLRDSIMKFTSMVEKSDISLS